MSEGFTEAGTHPRAEFLAAWDQLYGSGAAEADPWVWVIEFRVIQYERKALKGAENVGDP